MRSVRRLGTTVACSPPISKLVTEATGGFMPSRGIRIDLSHADVPDRIRAAVLWNLYERAEIGLIKKYLPPDLDVLELGSSFGVTAAHALATLDDDRRMIAVEANESLLPVLHQVLADDRVLVRHGAIAYGSDEPFIEFHVHPTNHLQSRLNARPTSLAVQVPRLTIAQLVEEHGLDRYSLIADIEGAEAGILDQDAESLAGCQLMIIELHSTTYDNRRIERAALASQVERLGFRMLEEQRRTAVYARR